MIAGKPPVKYYGKWPFTRVWFVQEVASSACSVINLLPHAYYLNAYPAEHWMKPYWRFYSATWVNTWLWSAVFHARDTPVTMRLDYYFSNLAVMVSFMVSCVRVLSLERTVPRVLCLVPLVALLLAHIGYMQFVKFDFGWNMVLSALVVSATALLWTGWAVVQQRPYAWKIVASLLSVLLLGALEIFDFPPLWGFLDAHSIWHGLTPLASLLWYSFLHDDATHELNSSNKTS